MIGLHAEGSKVVHIGSFQGDSTWTGLPARRDLRAIGYTVDRERVPGGNGLHRYRLHLDAAP